VLTVVVAAGLVVGNGHVAPVWIGSAAMGFATAPQFPMMMTYLERRIHVTGMATSWFVGAAGLGGLVFPWAIGRWFGAIGPEALPWSMLVLGVLTVGSFVATDRRLGGPATAPAGDEPS
jgi:predicted MFS family arabinose efflux permease